MTIGFFYYKIEKISIYNFKKNKNSLFSDEVKNYE